MGPPDPPHSTPPRPEVPGEDVPWGQRFFDRPFLLLILGIAIMAVFYTGWGLLEIGTMTPAPLP
jgi:hypothetical protein